jgi:hypothetical protein
MRERYSNSEPDVDDQKEVRPTTIVLANDKLVALPFKERSFNGHDVEDTE